MSGVMLDEVLAQAARAYQAVAGRTFRVTDVVAAFRYMAQARHIGKVVVTHPAPARPGAERCDLSRDRRTERLGLLVAEWLASVAPGISC